MAAAASSLRSQADDLVTSVAVFLLDPRPPGGGLLGDWVCNPPWTVISPTKVRRGFHRAVVAARICG